MLSTAESSTINIIESLTLKNVKNQDSTTQDSIVLKVQRQHRALYFAKLTFKPWQIHMSNQYFLFHFLSVAVLASIPAEVQS
jgi:hypothetical protein